MTDTFRTLRESASSTIRIKGSRFIGESLPVASEDEADQALSAVREREHKATHHCSAYRLGIEGKVYRYNDDGEPSGTAGPPILKQIDARDLTDTLVVVTRYYGGTKLGTGGLVRAYGDAAAEALATAATVERVVRVPVRMQFDYGDTSPVMSLLHRFDAEVGERHYGADTELLVHVRRSEADAFCEAFTEALADRGSLHRGGE